MRAEPTEQHTLLTLAEIDTGLDRADHRRRTLAEQAALETAEQEVASRAAAVEQAEKELAGLVAQQEAADAEVEAVRSRVERNRSLMDTVRVPKELEGLQHEVDTLRARQTELEDAELEVMEQVESAEGAVAQVRDVLAAAEQAREQARQERDAAVEAISADEADLRSRRDEAAGSVSVPLLEEYERVRERVGDPGAALLRRGRCEGCHLELPNTALEAVRHMATDQVAYCEECERILVRTEASGL